MQEYIGKLVQLIYVDRKQQVSIRDVRVLAVKDGKLKAYCLASKAPRIFHVDGIVDMELIRRAG
ncbi:hypothetical protein [Paenibacillus curdlanolyticus]|nr:hypothetical protein [Paenibacillus curdlanolyticus]